MPTIPRLESPQVTDSGPTGARIGVRADAQDLGAGIGQGISNVGGTVARFALEEKQKADSLAVTDADAQLAEWENSRLYDPQSGALNTRGKDSFELPDTVMEEYRQFISGIEAGLGNDAQREAFRKLSQARGLDIDRTIQRHVASEYRQYDQQATDAALASSLEAAAEHYTDSDRINTELTRQRSYIMAQAARTGEPAEVTNLRIAEAESATHVAVIDRILADKDYERAQEYYEVMGDHINASVKPQIESALNTGRIRGESQAKADTLVEEGKTREEALSEARDIEDPELRDETVRRVNTRYDEIQAVEAEAERLSIDNAVDLITNGGSVDDIDPLQWNAMDQETRSQLRALEARGEWFQDDARWYEFIQKSESEIAGMNLYTELRPYVDDQHWDRALAMQADARSNDANAFTNTITFRQRLENSLQGTVFDDVSDLNKTDAQRYAQLENEAARRIELFEADKGDKATGTEMQGVIDEMLLETVNLSRMFRDTTIPASAVLEDDKGDAYVPYDEIPSEEISSIENLILSNNRRVTQRKVEKAYAAYLINDPELFLRLTSE